LTHVTYIISDIGKALAFEWIAERIDSSRLRLSFILLNPGPSDLEDYLRKNNHDVTRVTCSGKKDWPGAFITVYRLLRRQKPDHIHCHLLQANIIGLSAAKLAGIRSRIYTRHHSSLHHVYHRKGVFWDKLANRLATKIVAISGIVKHILTVWEKADAGKIVLIPHGFDLELFATVPDARVQAFRQRHHIPADKKVVGVISRFTEWKGVQYIIPAFAACYHENPDTILVLLNAKGDYKDQLEAQLRELPDTAYRLITFENDVAAAYHSMSVFVHTPVDEHCEAFGQIYVEALAAGIPAVFSPSGIAPDFIRDGENALVVPFRDAAAAAAAIASLLQDRELCARLIINGKQAVQERFSIGTMINALTALYEYKNDR
jgi:glycosyltransferase involved in cell wall biosynthesis